MDETTDRIMRRHVVIDGFPPNIGPDRREKFTKLLRMKLAQKLQVDENVFQISCISDPAGYCIGAFVEFARESDAMRAVEICHMLNLTKTDAIRVYSWSTFVASSTVADEYEPPEVDMAQDAVDLSNLMMMDKEARPVFLVKSGEDCDVTVHRIEWQRGTVSVIERPSPSKDNYVGKWSEVDRRKKAPVSLGTLAMPCWTPLGTYLISIGMDGLKFWAGDLQKATCLIPSDSVQAVHVTPSERFAVVRLQQTVEIWDIVHSRQRRSLYGLDFDMDVWPPLKFSAGDLTCSVVTEKVVDQRIVYKTIERPNDKGVAEKVQEECIENVLCQRVTFYETETMRVIQGPERVESYSLKIAGLRGCEWSPSDPHMVALVSHDDKGMMGWRLEISRVVLSAIDAVGGRQPLVHLVPQFSRPFVKATRLDVLWHPNGTHLAAKVVLPSAQGTTATEYCLFEMGRSGAAAQQLRIDGSPLRFVWQPHGSMFAVSVMRSVGGGEKCVVVVYGFGGLKGSVEKLGQVPTSATNLYWSAHSGRILAVNYATQTIEIVRVVAGEGTRAAIVEISHKMEYKGVTNVEWDPSGRYFAAWSRSDKSRTGNRPRWTVYDFSGKLVHDSGDHLGMLSHVAFRPLARPVLSAEEIAEARKALPAMSEKWDSFDADVAEKAARDQAEQRRKQEAQYIARMNDIYDYVTKHNLDDVRYELECSAPSAKPTLSHRS